MLENVGDRLHSKLREPLLKFRPHERKLGQSERAKKFLFGARLDNVNAVRSRPRLWLRALDGKLCDKLVRSAADRNGKAGCVAHRVSNPMRRGAERLVMIDAFGAAHVEVPFVYAGAFDDGREALENFANLVMPGGAGFAGNGNAHRVGTKSKCAGNWHPGANAELARLP